MKFNLNDNVACGFLTGINPFDIRNYVIAAAKERGLHLHDINMMRIEDVINENDDVIAAASSAYTSYTLVEVGADMTEEEWEKAVSEKTALGYGEVPDDMVFAVIDRELDRIAAHMPSQKLIDASDHFKSIQSVRHGNIPFRYTHIFVTNGGRVLVFEDKDSDMGRIIAPLHDEEVVDARINGEHSTPIYEVFFAGDWTTIRDLDEDEQQAYAILRAMERTDAQKKYTEDHRTLPRRTNHSKLADMRRKLGLTQQQLAKRADCYAKDISRWELGICAPSTKSLKKLATALGCNMEDIS